MKGQEKDDFSPGRRIATATGAGMTLLTCIGLGIYLGLRIDTYFNSAPFGLTLMSLIGAGAGLWSVIRKMLER